MSQHILQSLPRRWWIVVLFLLICTGAGLIYGLGQEPTYQAQATYVGSFSTSSPQDNVPEDNPDRLEELSGLVLTYCEILESQAVAEAAVTSLALPAESLSHYTISCDVMPSTYVLVLQVQGPDPVRVTDLANAVGAAGVDEVSILQGEYELRQLDEAVVDTAPISPAHAQNALLGAGAGLVLSAAYVLVHRVTHPTGVAERVDRKGVPSAISEVRVLVVDDDEPTARMLRASLQYEGYQVEIVHNGEDGLKVARDWKPHLVLLDVMLPDMSGFEVCHHIRQSEQIDAVPIIMLTAKGQFTDKAEAFSAGADDYLVKPVELAELRMRVQAQIRRTGMIPKGQQIAST